MKVFFDNNTRTITIENVNKYFTSGSLVATADSNNVSIKYTNNDKLEVFDDFSAFTKQDGSSAGANVSSVVSYLNGEFNKGLLMGSDTFSGLTTTKTVTDSRITSTDNIIVQGLGSLNEVLGVTVSNGSFIITRTVIVALTGLTNNLVFKWVRF